MADSENDSLYIGGDGDDGDQHLRPSVQRDGHSGGESRVGGDAFLVELANDEPVVGSGSLGIDPYLSVVSASRLHGQNLLYTGEFGFGPVEHDRKTRRITSG